MHQKHQMSHHLIAVWGAVQSSPYAEQLAASATDECLLGSTWGRVPHQQMVTTAQSSPSLRHTKSFIAPNMRFAKSSHVILSHPPRLLKVSWMSFLLAPIQHRLRTPRNEEENCTALTDRRRLVVKRTKSEKMCVKKKNFFHPRLAQLSIETEIHSGNFPHGERSEAQSFYVFATCSALNQLLTKSHASTTFAQFKLSGRRWLKIARFEARLSFGVNNKAVHTATCNTCDSISVRKCL